MRKFMTGDGSPLTSEAAGYVRKADGMRSLKCARRIRLVGGNQPAVRIGSNR